MVLDLHPGSPSSGWSVLQPTWSPSATDGVPPGKGREGPSLPAVPEFVQSVGKDASPWLPLPWGVAGGFAWSAAASWPHAVLPPGPPTSFARGPEGSGAEPGLTAEPYPPGTPPLPPPPPWLEEAGSPPGPSCPIALPPLLLAGQREEIAGIPPCSCVPCGAGGGHGFGAGRSLVWEGRLGAEPNPPWRPLPPPSPNPAVTAFFS